MDGATQNVHIKWFHDIGVGTRLKTLNLILITTLGSEQNDWYEVSIGVSLDLGTELMTIHLRHHDIANYKVGHSAESLTQSFTTIDAGMNIIVVLEFMLKVGTYLVVILGNDNGETALIRNFHGGSLSFFGNEFFLDGR